MHLILRLTSLFCIMSAVTQLNAMHKPSRVNPEQQRTIDQLKKAIRESSLALVQNTLKQLKGPVPNDILFCISGDTAQQVKILDTIVSHLNAGKNNGTAHKNVINFQNPNLQGRTIVHIAVQNSWITLLAKLIDYGADVTIRSVNGDIPITIAIARYCLLYNTPGDAVRQQIIEVLKKRVVLSTSDYTNLQNELSKKFSIEGTPDVHGKQKPPLPDFLKMASFTLATRSFEAPAGASTTATADQSKTDGTKQNVVKDEGQTVPESTVHKSNTHNLATSILIVHGKPLLALCTCAITCFCVYKYFYSSEGDEHQPEKKHTQHHDILTDQSQEFSL
jgi:hypothetical protein